MKLGIHMDLIFLKSLPMSKNAREGLVPVGTSIIPIGTIIQVTNNFSRISNWSSSQDYTQYEV